MIQALLTLAEISPARASQCFTLIGHIEHGDAEAFTPKAQALIREALESGIPMTDEQREQLTAVAPVEDRGPADITLPAILSAYGLTQTTLARRFGIPLRTVQNWAGSRSKAPDYVLKMIVTILDMERDR